VKGGVLFFMRVKREVKSFFVKIFVLVSFFVKWGCRIIVKYYYGDVLLRRGRVEM